MDDKPTCSKYVCNSNNRFINTSEEDIQNLIDANKIQNTEISTKWAVGVFEAWRKERNQNSENIPELTKMKVTDLNCYLARFSVECRRVDGKEYPASSLYNICCGIQRFLKDNGISEDIMKKENRDFMYFHNALNSKMKDLTSRGIGVQKKQASALSLKEEEIIWSKRIFGDDSAQSLSFTVYYYNCKLFGLRGRDEHRSLDCSQFEVSQGKIAFYGRTSKTYKGDLSNLNSKAKIIEHFDSEKFNISFYYAEYLQLIGNDGPFYRKPLDNLMDQLRYSKQVIGVNNLSKYIPRICALAEISGNFTSHSGKVSLATQLYDKGVPEKLIQERTGHRSTTCLRLYNRTTEAQKRGVSDNLNPIINQNDTQTIKRSKNDHDGPLEIVDDGMDKIIADATRAVEEIINFSGVFNNCTFQITLQKH